MTTIRPAHWENLTSMLALLAANDLPVQGLDAHLGTALTAWDDARLVGTAALEVYGTGALLRSVAVDATHRGTGLGRRLTEAALALAQQLRIETVYLLTTTAPGFFAHLGFEEITREVVAPAVRQSEEFTTLCPDSAIVMKITPTLPTETSEKP